MDPVKKTAPSRSLSAEEKAKKLENENDENGCGGTVLEDHSDASSEQSASSEEEMAEDVNNPMLRTEEVEVCGHDSGTTCVLTLYRVGFDRNNLSNRQLNFRCI